MNKLNYIDISIRETGELISKEQYEDIQKEEFKKEVLMLCWKIENNPYDMTLDEILLYRKIVKKKKSKIVNYKMEEGSFICISKQDKEVIRKLNVETKALLYELSDMINKSGILIYGNHKPIGSFEKLKLYIDVGHCRWGKIKSDLDEFDIIVKRKDDKNRSILIVNPFFALSSTEITEIRFIVFGNLLKKVLDFDDYLFLCKKYDIVPEF